MKLIKTLSVLFSLCLVFDSCKKGEDDPFFSLRSRKARVAGEWKMTSVKMTNMYTGFGSTDTEILTGNGTTYTQLITSGGVTDAFEGTLTYDIEFKKDGTFELRVNQDDDPETITGVWNFTGGVGKQKNKSQITLFENTNSSSSGSSSTTGKYFDITYDLKELRHKKMVFYAKSESYSDGVMDYTYEYEIVLEAK